MAVALCDKGGWVQNYKSILEQCYYQLDDSEPNKEGDILVYTDITSYGFFSTVHVAKVVTVDGEGFTTIVESKLGSFAGEWKHHPLAPGLKDVLQFRSYKREYWRKKSDKQCCTRERVGGWPDNMHSKKIPCCTQ